MRRWLVGLVTAGLLVPGTAAWGAWTDTASTSGTTLTAGSLTAVAVSCAESTAPVLVNAATVSWTPSTWPTTLTYSARIVENGQNVAVSGNSSAQVLPSLFGAGLFGATVTVRVTGTLSGTSWSVSTDRTVFVGLLGAYVDCS